MKLFRLIALARGDLGAELEEGETQIIPLFEDTDSLTKRR